MGNIDELIKLSEDELGYIEKASNKDLDSKTANSGNANWTKYGRDMAKYGHPTHDAWCMTFVCWLFMKTFGADMANKLLCGKLSSASTIETKDAFKTKKQLVPLNDAKRGDVMFRSRDGGGHVELCAGRDAQGRIITIGGNTNGNNSWNGGMVYKHVGSSWEWCARPNWSLLDENVYNIGWNNDVSKDNPDYAKHWWYAYGTKKGEYYHDCAKEISGEVYLFNDKGYSVCGMANVITDMNGKIIKVTSL